LSEEKKLGLKGKGLTEDKSAQRTEKFPSDYSTLTKEVWEINQ